MRGAIASSEAFRLPPRDDGVVFLADSRGRGPCPARDDAESETSAASGVWSSSDRRLHIPMLSEQEWADLMRDLRNPDDADLALAASERLQQTSGLGDVSRLRELLKDESVFIRAAAAWPQIGRASCRERV